MKLIGSVTNPNEVVHSKCSLLRLFRQDSERFPLAALRRGTPMFLSRWDLLKKMESNRMTNDFLFQPDFACQKLPSIITTQIDFMFLLL